MHLSCLLINVGDNPDRPRPGRLWLRNLYHVHQRLCMGFPSATRKLADAEFLAPFAPEDFGKDHVHVRRDGKAGFLFRIEPQPAGTAVILVQSATPPDWDYAFQNARYLLAAKPQSREYAPSFPLGQKLRFCLLANPTRKLGRSSVERDGKPVAERWHGKRVPVPHERLLDWLDGWRYRCEGFDRPSGFSIDRTHTSTRANYAYVKRGGSGQGYRLFAARFEGILQVTDPGGFATTIAHGIGPAKAFGFGLLSVAACAPGL